MMKYARSTYVQHNEETGTFDAKDLPDWFMQPGMGVVFSHPRAGYYPHENTQGLQVGETYILEEVEVGRFHTSVTLEGVAGKFNSVLFTLAGSQNS